MNRTKLSFKVTSNHYVVLYEDKPLFKVAINRNNTKQLMKLCCR